MKRILIGALVGGLLLWAWQFVSYGFPNFHYAAVQYTPKQDSLLATFERLGLEEGGYLMPDLPKGSDWKEGEKMMETMKDKPWAMIRYYKHWDASFGLCMAKQVIGNIFMMALVGFAISGLGRIKFGNAFVLTMIFGTVAFIGFEYTPHIWFPAFDIMASFLDVGAGWGIVALWHGWWYSRKQKDLYA